MRQYVRVIFNILATWTERYPWLPGSVAVLLTWGCYFLWLWPHMLYTGTDGIYSGWRTVWADWSAHYTYASVFAYRSVTDWFAVNPIFIDGPFNYPFIPDAITGILMRFGVDSVSAFVVPSIIVTLVLLVLMTIFYRSVLHSNRLAWLAISLFMCSGGMGFIYFVQDFMQTPSLATLLYPPREYTYLPAQHIEAINFVSSEFLPQRGILFGMTLALGITILCWRWYQRDFQQVSYRKMVWVGIASSGLMLIHVHSLLALACVCAVLFLYSLRHYRHWLSMAIAAGIPTVVLLMLLHGGDAVQSFVGWYPGWMATGTQAGDINWFYFWLLNWGLFLPVAVYGFVRYGGFRQPLVVAGFVLFGLSNLVKFQPWIWDNLKILTWSYALLVIPVVMVLSRLWQRKTVVYRSLSVVLCVGIVLTGALELWRLTQVEKHHYRMWDQTEISLAQSLREISQPTDVILTSDHHHHWVTALSGRQVILGYKGWLFSYGINYQQQDQDIRTMFAGGTVAEQLMQKYQVRFVVIGPSERTDYQANDRYFQQNHTLLMQQGHYRVYKVTL